MSIRETAEDLSISPHTLKNWLKRDNRELREFTLPPEEERLTKRANKKHSKEQTIPLELVRYKENLPLLLKTAEKFGRLSPDIHRNLFLFVLVLLEKRGYLRFSGKSGTTARQSFPGDGTGPPVLQKALLDFMHTLSPLPEKNLLPQDFPGPLSLPPALLREPDLPGLLYQALRPEGNKIRHGAYFTPPQVIGSMLPSGRNGTGATAFLDPCCGSGMFLCAFAEMTGQPEKAGGMDKDPAAVFLARINLFLRFPRIACLDHIRVADALHTDSWDLKEGCLVATNPPWGAHYSQEEKKEFRRRYGTIRSGESFSLFMARAVEEMPPANRASFLLPESLLYVKTHRDIRELLLERAPPENITHFGRLFHGVYTPAIRMTIRKQGRIRKSRVFIRDSHGRTLLSEKQLLKRYRENGNRIINIHCSNRDAGILAQIDKGSSGRLGGDCRWILGTVTGDNRRFLTEKEEGRTLPVLSGKEVRPYYAEPPRLYLRTDAGIWQQTRSRKDYRPEKIVYTFIGSRPSFAVDRTGVMTLNSANCLIPGREHALEELAGWYNSRLFRFLWRKRFHSLKLLKSHLELLPVPVWGEKEKEILQGLVKAAENRQDVTPEIDRMVFDVFGLSPEDRAYVASDEWV